MSLLPRGICWRSLRRRFLHGCILLCYLAATLGLPIPARARKDASQPFPCQDNPCGCQSAEQCWTSCCCYTVEEHWAWARAHDVDPPSYAAPPADDGWDTRPERGCEECHAVSKSCSHCNVAPPCQAHKGQGMRWINGLASLRCQGGSTLGTPGAISTLPPPPLNWQPCLPAETTLLDLVTCPIEVCIDPLDPPPRSLST